MKKTISTFALAAMLMACGNTPAPTPQAANPPAAEKVAKSSAKKFAPQKKESTMNSSERQAAIAKKRSSLAVVSFDEVMKMQGVKFSILPPAANEELSVNASDKLCNKMIQIAAQNGISGLCTNPVLAMVAQVNRTESGMTNTIPQKAIVKYEITYYCGNMITNDIYASCKQSVTGVGPDFEEATEKALDEIECNKQMSDMLSKASERAIEWYSTTNSVKSLVEEYIAKEDYALALAMLNSVPTQADSTYAYASKRSLEVTTMLFEEKAVELLAGMKSMIAENDTCYNAEVGAIFKLISPRSAVYAEAKECFNEYALRIQKLGEDKRRMENEIEAEKRKMEYDAAAEKRSLEHELMLAEMEVRKITAPIEAKATLEKMKIDASVKKSTAWSSAFSSAAASIGHGMRGGMFGENGMFGQGGILGIGSFAEPLNRAVDGTFELLNKDDD